ncbi:MAG: HAD-IA family hydrolase [Actinomycetia bacterium]|nr:HAD-IA family hydrolase [Actinomycetes bacterium]MCP3910211.1 HAD-IA family hydrolase [Actinomycetes bacterium]MCP4087776.1 HAD-IA family hydrolase [Actinomycetes bacterium]
MIRAVLFDFGGVVLSSPFEAFAGYERDNGLPEGLIRHINSTNPDDNAWAHLERSDVTLDGFAAMFEAEAGLLGHEVSGRVILGLLSGDPRPRMVEAVRRCSEQMITACLTNNFMTKSGEGSGIASRTPEREDEVAKIMTLFDEVIESSRIGIRKPELGFYERALEILEIEANEAVFLDDLGINLKPAKAMGMTTIKVVDPDEAIRELEQVVGFALG